MSLFDRFKKYLNNDKGQKQPVPTMLDLSFQLIIFPSTSYCRQKGKHQILDMINQSPGCGIDISLGLLKDFVRKTSTLSSQINSEGILILLEMFHILLKDDRFNNELSVLIKEYPMNYFNELQRQETLAEERLTTEQSTSSFMPQFVQMVKSETPPEEKSMKNQRQTAKEIKVKEKRMDKTTTKPIEQVVVRQPRLTTSQFMTIHYQYLMKVTTSIDLFGAVTLNSYPYQDINETLDPRVQCLWIYKIQNLQKQGLPLLQVASTGWTAIQRLIWADLCLLQNFLSQELLSFSKTYDHYSDHDCLQMVEIIQEFMDLHQVLDRFQKIFPSAQELPSQLVGDQSMIDILMRIQVQIKAQLSQTNKPPNSRVQEESKRNEFFNNHYRQRSGCPILNVQRFTQNQNKENMVPVNHGDQYESAEQSVENSFNPYQGGIRQDMTYEKKVAAQMLVKRIDTLGIGDMSNFE